MRSFHALNGSSSTWVLLHRLQNHHCATNCSAFTINTIAQVVRLHSCDVVITVNCTLWIMEDYFQYNFNPVLIVLNGSYLHKFISWGAVLLMMFRIPLKIAFYIIQMHEM